MASLVEVYFKCDMTLDELADRLREIFNIPQTNRTPYAVDQCRDSINHGGTYYNFDIFGLTMRVLSNAGEVEIHKDPKVWPFYMLISSQDQKHDLKEEDLKVLVSHVVNTCISNGIDAEMEE